MNKVLVSKQNNIGIITLNSIDNKNTVNSDMLEEIAKTIEEFEKDSNVKAAIIRGQNNFFITGMDVAELLKDNVLEKMQNDFEKIENFSKPIIATVNGPAIGIGFEIAMACDFVLASEEAIFAFAETSLNFIPCFGGFQRMISAIGKSKAMEAILTNRAINVDEAEKSGIVSRVISLNELESEAIKVASQVTNISEKCLCLIRESLKNKESSNKMRIEIEKRSSKLAIADTKFKESLINS